MSCETLDALVNAIKSQTTIDSLPCPGTARMVTVSFNCLRQKINEDEQNLQGGYGQGLVPSVGPLPLIRIPFRNLLLLKGHHLVSNLLPGVGAFHVEPTILHIPLPPVSDRPHDFSTNDTARASIQTRLVVM